MAQAQASPRCAATVLLALACGACFSPSGGDTAATTDVGTTPGTGTSAPGTGTSTSGTGLTSSTSGVTTTGTATTPTSTTTGDPTGGTATATATGDTAICGNGDLESGEECDDGNLAGGDGCSPTCESESGERRFVFLTSQTFTGEVIGGLDGGANRCKTLADSAEALPELNGRQWVAWLSDGNKDAVTQIGDFGGEYVLPDDHVVVAKGTSGLISGSLLAPINEDEKGVAGPSIVPCDQNPDDPVWTGTRDDGTRAFDSHCGNWVTTSGVGAIGVYSATDKTWTDCNARECLLAARLYCVEI